MVCHSVASVTGEWKESRLYKVTNASSLPQKASSKGEEEREREKVTGEGERAREIKRVSEERKKERVGVGGTTYDIIKSIQELSAPLKLDPKELSPSIVWSEAALPFKPDST